MGKQYAFTQKISGSNDGYTISYYKKGDVVEQKDLCEYLFNSWIKSGVIKESEAEKLHDTSSGAAEDAGAKENDGAIQITSEDKENSTEGASEGSKLTDEKIGELVYQAKEILEVPEGANLSEEDIGKLKAIGIELKIEGMQTSKKPQTILDKINKYVDEYENIGEEIPL